MPLGLVRAYSKRHHGAIDVLGAFFSALGVIASFFGIRTAIMCGMCRIVHGARHRETRRTFWLAVALAFIAAFAFMLAGGAYQS